MKKLSLNDLRPGDVVLFSPEKNSFISWAITFLTDAPVSHASLVYQAQPLTIIEETPPQVAVNPAEKRFHNRTVSVLRHKTGKSLAPVINAAEKHLNHLQPYDDTGLYMVGAILLYKKLSLSSRRQKIIIRILKKLTATIMHHIQQHKTPGKLPMVCSQFVAQCFDDAGDDYRLQFRRPVLDYFAAGSLLDQAEAWFAQQDRAPCNTPLTTVTEAASGEELCRELKLALEEESVQENADMEAELAVAIRDFARVHRDLAEEESVSADGNDMQLLRDNINMFVAPGDFLLHCTSLTQIGTISI